MFGLTKVHLNVLIIFIIGIDKNKSTAFGKPKLCNYIQFEKQFSKNKILQKLSKNATFNTDLKKRIGKLKGKT